MRQSQRDLYYSDGGQSCQRGAKSTLNRKRDTSEHHRDEICSRQESRKKVEIEQSGNDFFLHLYESQTFDLSLKIVYFSRRPSTIFFSSRLYSIHLYMSSNWDETTLEEMRERKKISVTCFVTTRLKYKSHTRRKNRRKLFRELKIVFFVVSSSRNVELMNS